MKKTVLLLPLLTLLASCGTASSKPTLSAQAKKPNDDIAIQAFARACTTQVAALVVDLAAENYSFVTPGATCTNEFLGAEALTPVESIKSSSVVAGSNLNTVTITVTGQTNRKYALQMDIDLNTTVLGFSK